MNNMAICLLVMAAFLPFGSTLPKGRHEFPARIQQPETRKFAVDLGAPRTIDFHSLNDVEGPSTGIDVDVPEREKSRAEPSEQNPGEKEPVSLTFVYESAAQSADQAEHSTAGTSIGGLGQLTTVLKGQKSEESSAGVNIEDDNQTSLGYKNQAEDEESALESTNQGKGGSSTASYVQGSDDPSNTNNKQGEVTSPSGYDDDEKDNSTEAGQEGTENKQTHDQDSTNANKNSQSHATGQEGTENKQTHDQDSTNANNNSQSHATGQEGTENKQTHDQDSSNANNNSQSHATGQEGTGSAQTGDEDGTSGDNKKLVVLVKVVWVQGKDLQNQDDDNGQPWRGQGK